MEEVEVPEEMGSQLMLGSLVNVRTWAFTLGGTGSIRGCLTGSLCCIENRALGTKNRNKENNQEANTVF